MDLLVGLLAGVPIGFVLGVVCVKVWGSHVNADYVTIKGETDRLAKYFTTEITTGFEAVHRKLDTTLAAIRPK